MELNAILSGIAAWKVKPNAGAGFSPGGTGKGQVRADGVVSTQDSFEQGQWWKNRAVAKGGEATAGARSCSCGACSPCGSRAYAGMAAAMGGGAAGPATGASSAAAGQPRSATGGATERPASGELYGADGNRQKTSGAEPGTAGRAAEAAAHDDLARGWAGQSAGPPAGAAVDAGIAAADRPATAAKSAVAEENKAGEAQARAARQLSREQQQEVARLQQIETRVKAHEMAHLAVAGPYARGGASFSYTMGPDGQKYITGGEVSIDTSKEPTPEATIRKMQIIRAAAMAPVDPSPQDHKVAAQANAALTEARRELEMARLEQRHQLNRQELDMLSLNRTRAGEETLPGHPQASPQAARQAAATLAGFERPDPQLRVAA